TSFGFVIIIAALLNIGAQVNIWRIISVSKMRGQDIANAVLPGLGYFVTFLIIIGGVAFNMGNLAGAGLGLNALLGIPPNVGASITAIICIFVFLSKEAGLAMDFIVRWLGDRKSTRLNSSHVSISYAVFCLKKKKKDKYIDNIYIQYQ